ncbi:hypothetical protein ACQKGC_16625 [Allorhizobium pseudoryzae]|uniref:hypothetical protein n=1 Tax=Allorhizobium pseudoryzae TaxID=379684 RepID=UPI003D01260B
MTGIAFAPEPSAIAGRSCSGCTACCVLPDIEALQKPADRPCPQCSLGTGCKAYETRPQPCRDFLCLWVSDDQLRSDWQPSRSGMLVYRQGAQLTVLVDPSRRGIWQSEPYAADLAHMAETVEADGGYLILFCGETVERIRPTPAAAART